MSLQSQRLYEFGPFQLDPAERRLLQQGRLVPLTPKAFQTLVILVENQGRLIEKDELLKKIWPDTFVEEATLAQNVFTLRKQLGDDRSEVVYIETVPKRGYRFIAPVTIQTSATLAAPGAQVNRIAEIRQTLLRRWPSMLIAGVLGGVLLLVILVAFDIAGVREWFGSRHRAIRSIVVLPLQNLSNDPQQDYFADGMTDELITELAQRSGLRVISRTSAMYYKNSKQMLPQIARELNVDVVLEGSVLRVGDRVRISAQLIQADGDRHLWAQSYERDLRDVLAMQGDIARDIVGEVRVTLRPRSESQPVNPGAYDAYLKGRHDLNNAVSEADIERSISNFDSAIAKDPQSALAYSGLAESYVALSDYYRAPREVMPKAKEAAEHALELDETLSEAHDALGWVELNYVWNWSVAEQHLKRAIELNPGNAIAHDHYAWYLTSFLRSDEGFAENQRAQQLDPFSLTILANGSFYFYMGRQYDRAIELGQRALKLDGNCYDCRTYVALAQIQKGQFKDALLEIGPVKLPDASPIALATTGSVLAAAGERLRAQKLLLDLQEIIKRRFVCPYEIATTYLALGDRDEAFKWLQKAYEEHSICMVWLNADARLDPLRSDPRFIALARRVGF